MRPTGHCELRLTRRYEASPSEVWAVLTEPDSIGRWLAPAVAVELAADGAGTLLSLDHHRIDERFGMTYMTRWTSALARLRREIGP